MGKIHVLLATLLIEKSAILKNLHFPGEKHTLENLPNISTSCFLNYPAGAKRTSVTEVRWL